jgi:hypothetical protein
VVVELDDAVRRHQRVVYGSEITPVPKDRARALVMIAMNTRAS